MRLLFQHKVVDNAVSTGSESRSDESHSGLQVRTSGNSHPPKTLTYSCFHQFRCSFKSFLGPAARIWPCIGWTCSQGCSRWGGEAGRRVWGPYWEVAERRSHNPAFLLADNCVILNQSRDRQDWEKSDAFILEALIIVIVIIPLPNAKLKWSLMTVLVSTNQLVQVLLKAKPFSKNNLELD